MDGSPETWRWIWLATAVLFAVGEIAVAGTFFLAPFAVGAAVAAAAAFAGAAIGVEWLLFVAVSAGAAAVLIPFGRRLDQRTGHQAIGSNRWVGRQAVVLREIPAGHGEAGLVRLEREEWRAESLLGTRIRAGSTVLVSRVDGTRLVVVSIEEAPELEA
jgi:membrane protein implicated in regulation of membrane protease activity